MVCSSPWFLSTCFRMFGFSQSFLPDITGQDPNPASEGEGSSLPTSLLRFSRPKRYVGDVAGNSGTAIGRDCSYTHGTAK